MEFTMFGELSYVENGSAVVHLTNFSYIARTAQLNGAVSILV